MSSSNIFENIYSPDSYDSNIDKGWKEISQKGQDPIESIYLLLVKVYWAAVEEEMVNAILAFDDYATLVPEGLPDLQEETLQSEYLRELVDLWDPLGLSDQKKKELCETIFHNVKERQNKPQDWIVACALLQACGLTDYDYVQEYRKPTFPSLGAAAQVDTRYPGVFEAIQCSECRWCIRSFHFYECKRGCLDCIVNRSHVKTAAGKKPTDSAHFWLDHCMFPVPFRLCCSCVETSSHPRDHLKVIWRFRKAGDEGNRQFSRELDALEDHRKGQSLLSFGNTFLDHLSKAASSLKSMNSRQLFPAGNAHCALMFGPLLIENGMTIYPGGALISNRPLPSLGRHSSREVKECLCPENFQTIEGCDVLCTEIYSVSPDRRIYEATKKFRDRRFLCARKQLSGGLFTDYNSRPKWKVGEDKFVQLFIALASEWRRLKSPTGPEARNRSLLKECGERLREVMQTLWSEEINVHLLLLAQKLGKTQKLSYSRISNNCQDFCNGLLIYERFLYPTFEAMYPFIPESVKNDIIKEPDDISLSYLQSFVQPLQYPTPGFQSRRMLLGSAIALYSGFAQNDADLIDHVWSVRFGYDHQNGFSFGFTIGDKEGDEYLLKDEEMSCSDRFAEQVSSESGHKKEQACTLADHLLDCPADNLSVLQTHLLRQQRYYFNREGEFLSTLGAKAWMVNRLEVLRRLKLMHDFLAEIASQFQNCCSDVLPAGCNVKALRKIWDPVGTVFARAWHMDKRKGRDLHFAPDMDFSAAKKGTWESVGFFTLGTPLLETHRQLLYSRELFTNRLKTLKSLLSSCLRGKEEIWSPWEWCTCYHCKVYRLKYTCDRLDWNYLSAVNENPEQQVIVRPGHPDYFSTLELEKVLHDQEYWKEVVENSRQLLNFEEEDLNRRKLEWEKTYLLCLRLIYGIDVSQVIGERLSHYKWVFEGKEVVDSSSS